MGIKIISLFVLLSTYLLAQNHLSQADSTLWQSAKPDTSQLRNLSISRKGAPIAAKAQMKLAFAYYNNKNENQAQSDFLSVYSNYAGMPEAKKACLYLGKIAFHKNDMVNAKKYLEEYLLSSQEGKDADWANEHVLKIKKTNHDPSYLTDAKSFVSTNAKANQKTLRNVKIDIIKSVYNKHNYKQTAAEATAYISSHSVDSIGAFAKYYMVRAKYQTQDSDYVTAAREFLDIDKKHIKKLKPTVHAELIRYLTKTRDYASALTEAQKMVTLYPKDSLATEMSFQIGELYTLLDRKDDAIAYYMTLKDNAKNNKLLAARSQFQMAEVYLSKNDFANAGIGFNTVITSYPEATYYVVTSKFSLALTAYREGLQTQSTLHPAPGYNEMKDFIATYPEDKHVPRALRAFAELAVREGKYTEAIRACNKIIGFDTSLFLKKKKYVQAANDIKNHQALALEAMNTKARILRENMHLPADALVIYNQLLTKNSNDEETLYRKAQCLIELNRNNGAKVIFGKLAAGRGKYAQAAQYQLKNLK